METDTRKVRTTAEGRPAWVHLDSWAGRTRHRVTVLAETPKRYRVRWDDDSAFRRVRGEVYSVPKYAVTFEPDASE